MEQLKDITLVNAYYQGDESALATLIDRHNQAISSFIYNKVRNRDLMQDIFQDTFIKIICALKREGFTEGGSFRSWAIRIAQNLIFDHYRKQKRISILDTNEDFDIFSVIPDNGEDYENKSANDQHNRAIVETLIGQLSSEQARVMKLRFYHQLSFKEIAVSENVSINTVIGRARYARLKMKDILEKERISLEHML